MLKDVDSDDPKASNDIVNNVESNETEAKQDISEDKEELKDNYYDYDF